jgi:hypothetical protein
MKENKFFYFGAKFSGHTGSYFFQSIYQGLAYQGGFFDQLSPLEVLLYK